MSPRTFSRYFPTKESVVAAINDDMDEYVAKALEAQPLDVSEYEALLGAHLAIFGSEDGYETPAFRRMAVLIQIVNGSASFKSSAFSQRHAISDNAAIATIARRMGVTADDPAVLLVADTWTMLFATSFAGLGRVDGDRLEPQVLCDHLSATFELFRRSWSPWTAIGQPHTSATSR